MHQYFEKFEDVPVEAPKKKCSEFKGVCWDSNRKHWQAAITVNRERHWCGHHLQELDAAYAINRKCDELKIPRKNPSIGNPPACDSDESEKTPSKIVIGKKIASKRTDEVINYDTSWSQIL